MRTKFSSEVWFPEIVKQTEGKIKMHDFWSGVLLSSQEMLKGIGAEVAQVTSRIWHGFTIKPRRDP